MTEKEFAAIQEKTWVLHKYKSPMFDIYKYISNVKQTDNDVPLSKFQAIVYMRYKFIKLPDGRDHRSRVTVYTKPTYESFAYASVENMTLHKSWTKDALIGLFNAIFDNRFRRL